MPSRSGYSVVGNASMKSRRSSHTKNESSLFLVLACALVALLGVVGLVYGGDVLVPVVEPVIIVHRERTNRNVASAKEPATLLFVGDIMLGRYVETLMARNGEDYPFALADGTLQGVDTVVANLEGPIVTLHRQTPDDSLHFSFAPTVAALLKRHNIDYATLANNHGFDEGETGFEQTRTYLQNAGIGAFGSGREVGDVSVLHDVVKGHEVVFVGFHATQASFPKDDAVALLAATRTQYPDAFLAAVVHWGVEYQATANAFQRALGHAFIDAGADAVFGHHPHVVQDVEEYQGKPIYYSLGNFIFDQYFSSDVQHGLAVKVTLDDQEYVFEELPFESANSQPLFTARGE